ncbi:aldo/keto reductase [uncultured Treponema sp.]|uniref:aldo/keto reductase n=1 Tax=uncultured Treponema sp. TaxID=162155 RepID=UPI00280B396C|nr:aldo/keto reductase [uncultured Treponema sp.]
MSASLAKTNSVSKLQGNLRRFVVIPGSKNVDHIKDNLNIMDFKLTADEMAEIAKLDKGERYYHRTEEQLVQFAAWKPDFEKA